MGLEANRLDLCHFSTNTYRTELCLLFRSAHVLVQVHDGSWYISFRFRLVLRFPNHDLTMLKYLTSELGPHGCMGYYQKK